MKNVDLMTNHVWVTTNGFQLWNCWKKMTCDVYLSTIYACHHYDVCHSMKPIWIGWVNGMAYESS